ncbi:hypothetical protein [Winogradskyella haliclonae]|uniref:Uncharacterized protein n=1 Tax=Winogradskyella haliclonae TaxID=2048558 RepID=A0ABQ2C185_9FLAO|nr:hypothetical protein [Winogradskyella haliclonae]GGI56888.1 hypothetical protein GCM10011444_11970 [Winogradskyella haliclonae]
MKDNFKTLISIVVTLAFLFLAFGSEDDSSTDKNSSGSKEIKTSFASVYDAKDYIRYVKYKNLVKVWGEPELGKPYLYRGEYVIYATWPEVKVEGQAMKVQFKNSDADWNFSSKDGSPYKEPIGFPIQIQINDTGYGW